MKNFAKFPDLSKNHISKKININLWYKPTIRHNQCNHHKVHIKWTPESLVLTTK
jgi:hypothetical protein